MTDAACDRASPNVGEIATGAQSGRGRAMVDGDLATGSARLLLKIADQVFTTAARSARELRLA